MASLKAATDFAPAWGKSWHHWAYFNCEVRPIGCQGGLQTQQRGLTGALSLCAARCSQAPSLALAREAPTRPPACSRCCQAMVFYGRNDPAAAQRFVAPAVTGFFRSIELGQTTGGLAGRGPHVLACNALGLRASVKPRAQLRGQGLLLAGVPRGPDWLAGPAHSLGLLDVTAPPGHPVLQPTAQAMSA